MEAKLKGKIIFNFKGSETTQEEKMELIDKVLQSFGMHTEEYKPADEENPLDFLNEIREKEIVDLETVWEIEGDTRFAEALKEKASQGEEVPCYLDAILITSFKAGKGKNKITVKDAVFSLEEEDGKIGIGIIDYGRTYMK